MRAIKLGWRAPILPLRASIRNCAEALSTSHVILRAHPIAGPLYIIAARGQQEMLMKIFAVLIAALILATSVACNKQPSSGSSNPTANRTAQSTPDPFARARGIYAKDCQRCHGPTGGGGPVTLDDGTKLKVPSLREGHALRHPDSDFVKQITKGGDGMPAFDKKLSPAEIDQMIRFIRHEFQGK